MRPSLGLRQIRDIPGTWELLQRTTSAICTKDPDASINSRFLDLGPLIRTMPPLGGVPAANRPMGTENKQYVSTCLISFNRVCSQSRVSGLLHIRDDIVIPYAAGAEITL